jgi:hypothetical protein
MFDIPYKKRRVENKTPLDSQLSICKDSVFYKLYDIIEAIFGSFSTKKTPTPNAMSHNTINIILVTMDMGCQPPK